MSILNDKNNLLDGSTDHFLAAIKKLEKQIYSLILNILETLDKEGGVLSNNTFNLQMILRAGDEIKRAFNASQLNERVQAWVFNFDKVFEMNREYWATQGFEFDAAINQILSVEKQATINKLVSDLTGEGVNANVIQGIQQKIKEGIVTRQKYSDLKRTIKGIIVSDTSQSKLLRYASLITMDSIRGFDGTIQKVVSDEYEMEAFRYVGSLEKDSRKTCIGLINAPSAIYVPRTKQTFSNPYSHLVVEAGIYMQKDIPEIIRLSSNNPGWNPATTAATFFIYRGGYNCTHQAIPYKLSSRQKEIYKAKQKK